MKSGISRFTTAAAFVSLIVFTIHDADARRGGGGGGRGGGGGFSRGGGGGTVVPPPLLSTGLFPMPMLLGPPMPDELMKYSKPGPHSAWCLAGSVAIQ